MAEVVRSLRVRLYLAGLILVVLLAGCAAVPQGSAAPELRAAFVRSGDLWLWSNGRETRLTIGGRVQTPRFSSDGRFISYQQGQELKVIGLTGTGPWTIPTAWNGAWSPVANVLAIGSQQGSFVVPVDAAGPGTPQLVAAGWSNPVWSPDGQSLAVSRSERDPQIPMKGSAQIGIVPASGGKVRVLLTEWFEPVQQSCAGDTVAAAWSPDGRWLLLHRSGLTPSVAADCNEVAVISTAGGQPVTLAEMPRPAWAVWAPQNAHLAYVDGIGRMAWLKKQLRIARPPWRERPSLTPAGFADRDPAWAPTGTHLAFTRSEAKAPENMDLPAPGQAIYRLEVGQQAASPVSGSEGGFAPFWDKSGGLYWFRGRDVWSGPGPLIRDIDLRPSYYGQWAVEQVFDHWGP